MPDLESSGNNFNGLSASLADILYDVSTKINTVQKLLNRQKTRKNEHQIDHRIISLVDETTGLIKTAKAELQLILEWNTKFLTKQQELAQERLNREFNQLLKQFQAQQREFAELQRTVLIAAKKDIATSASRRGSSNIVTSENTPLLETESNTTNNDGNYESLQQQQEQILDVVQQEDIDFQQSLIQEREQEIQNIQEGISEINAIFKDLGTLVTQQGEQIDSFEDNITDMSANTRNAVDELVTANEYQRKKRNMSMCVLFVLLTVLAVILLAVSV